MSGFEMAGNSKYDPTNNIVLCGHVENTKQMTPVQNVCPKPMLAFSGRPSTQIQCPSFNHDVTAAPAVNAESQYWPHLHNYVPHDVNRCQWGQPYDNTLPEQNCQPFTVDIEPVYNNQNFNICTGTITQNINFLGNGTTPVDNQPFFGTSIMPCCDQTCHICPAQIPQNNQNYVETRSVPQIHQIFNFGPGLSNNIQPYPTLNHGTGLMGYNNNQYNNVNVMTTTSQYANQPLHDATPQMSHNQSINVSTKTMKEYPNIVIRTEPKTDYQHFNKDPGLVANRPTPIPKDAQSGSDDTPLHLSTISEIQKRMKEEKFPTLNNDVSLTGVINPARPDNSNKNDKNKLLTKDIQSLLKIDSDSKEKVQNCNPLQKIKLANGEIIHCKKIKPNEDSQKTKGQDLPESKTKVCTTKEKKESDGQSLYCNKSLDKSNAQSVSKKPKKLFKKSKQKSELIKKLQLKLQMVNDEIRKRQYDLKVKNTLIERELTSKSVTKLPNLLEIEKYNSHSENAKDIEASCETTKQIKIRKHSKLRSNDACVKKSTHSEPSCSTKKDVKFQTCIKDSDEKKKVKKSSNKDLKSVVNVVKHKHNLKAIHKPEDAKENCRSHKDKYYIIREKDMCRSIHKSNDPRKENVDVNKCKLRWKNAVYNSNKRDDLLIMFNNNTQKEQIKERKVKVQKRKKSSDENGNPAKIKKIHLVINLITEKPKPKNDSSLESESFSDFSFLDGINADEIVEYLKTSEKQETNNNSETDVSLVTLDSNDAMDTTSTASLITEETIDDERQEPDVDSQLNDTLIIDVKDERLDDSFKISETESVEQREYATKTSVPVSIKHEFCTENQRLSNAITAHTHFLAKETEGVINKHHELDEISKDVDNSSKCSEINNNDDTTKEKLQSIVTVNDYQTAQIKLNEETCEDKLRPLAGKDNILKKTVLATVDITQEIITITDDDDQESIQNKKEAMKINQDQSEIILIDDDLPETITLSLNEDCKKPEKVKSNDCTESQNNAITQMKSEIILIDDDLPGIVISSLNEECKSEDRVESQNYATTPSHYSTTLSNHCMQKNRNDKREDIKDEQETQHDTAGANEIRSIISENIPIQKIEYTEKLLLNSNKSGTSENKDLCEEVSVETEPSQSFEKANLNSSFCLEARTADSSKNDVNNVQIGGITLSIKDLIAEIESIETSFEDKNLSINGSKNNNNTIEKCSKYPCNLLHKILGKEEPPKTGAKTIFAETKRINNITEKYIRGQTKKKRENMVTSDKIPILEEMALAERLEDRVSEYANLNLSVCSVLHRGTYSTIFNCLDGEHKNVTAKIAKKAICQSVVSGYKKETILTKMQKDIPKENLGFVYIINGLAVDRSWCLLMDYYPKNLEQALRESGKGFDFYLIRKFAKQLVSAVAMLKNNGIVHSDIKPTHILLDGQNSTLKLCGFDESYYENKAQKVSNIGTVHYRAPEIILGHSAGHSIDVWSSALILYEMATNQKLFPATTNNEVLYQHMRTFGAVPWSMVNESAFKNAHYVGQNFLRRYFCKENNTMQQEVITAFPKTEILIRSILEAYVHNWAIGRTKVQKDSDALVLHQLYSLLMQMLVLDPTRRPSILDVNIS